MTEVLKEKQPNSTPLLEINDIGFSYNKNKEILKSLSFKILAGEIVGISGENGSGKSTLLKIIVGLLNPKHGEVIKRTTIGYSPQNLLLFDNLTVIENFIIFGKGLKLSTQQILIKSEEIMNTLNFLQYSDTLVKNLSGGTAQKLNFGISLLGDPDILVLDEPYQGLDYASFLAFWDIQHELRNMGKSIIIVSHLIEDQSKFTRSLHLINKKLQGCNRVDCPLCCGE